MLEQTKEITNAVDTREGELLQLRNRFEDDYKLWRIEPYQLGKSGEYDNFTTNEPRTLANKVMGILAYAPTQIRIPIKGGGEQRKQISNAEKFVYGSINLNDSRLQAIFQLSIQEQLAFYAILRGLLAIRVYIHNDKNKRTIPDIKVWDPLHISWETGGDSFLWVCNTRTISKAQAKAEFGIGISGNTKLYDFWDEEKYVVIINNKDVLREKHNLGHPPILICPVGPVPFIQSKRFQDTIRDVGESIYGSDRSHYEQKNKLLTHLLTIAGLGAHNPLALYSSGGKKTFEKSPYYKGAVIQFDVDKGERADALVKPEMPKEVAALLGAIQNELNLGGLSPLAFGQTPFPESGYQTNILIHAATSLLGPAKRTIERSLEWLSRELLTQYAKGGFKKLRLHGRDGSNEYFDVELSPRDIKGDWFPEVTLLPALPEDTAAQYAMAQTAVQNELLSKETARDRLLGIQDPDAEGDKILREKAMNLPPVLMRRLATALVNEGRPDLATALMEEFSRMGGGKAPAPRRGEEAVQPQYATGMPSYVLPAEEMGRTAETRIPPDVLESLRLSQLGMVRGV